MDFCFRRKLDSGSLASQIPMDASAKMQKGQRYGLLAVTTETQEQKNAPSSRLLPAEYWLSQPEKEPCDGLRLPQPERPLRFQIVYTPGPNFAMV